MRALRSKISIVTAAVAAVALAAPGAASAAAPVCPKGYSLASTLGTWWYPYYDVNGDGLVCLKTSYGLVVAIADDKV